MTTEDRRGTAYHEAGHIVVARALGLKVGASAIGINGKDSVGKTDVEHHKSTRLPFVLLVLNLKACLVPQRIATLARQTRPRSLS